MSNITNKDIKKQELKDRIIDTESLTKASGSSGGNEDKGKTVRRRIGILLLVLVIGAVLALTMAGRYIRFDEFKLRWINELSAGSIVDYEEFEGGFLKYSKDGAVYLKSTGEDIWIESYEMRNPKTDVNGGYIIVFDVGGNKIESFNKKGKVAAMETALPILKAAVSRTGIVTALVEDSTSTYILFFKSDGKRLDISVKSKLSGDGFPTDIAISEDGTALIVGYQYIKGSLMKGRVVFYDFSEIGQNMPNRVVGGFDQEFAQSIIASVRYLDKTDSVAVASSGLYFFSSTNTASPKLVKTVRAEDEIEAIDYCGKRMAVVMRNTSEEFNHTLYIYSSDGREILRKEFFGEFRELDMDKGYIYLTKDDHAIIMNMTGVIKYDGSLDINILKIKKIGIFSDFVLLGNNDFRGITLK